MKKVGLLTTTRADWGLLKALAKKLQQEKTIDFCLLVSGNHFLEKYGSTVNEIVADGFTQFSSIEFEMDNQTDLDIINSTSSALKEYGRCFSRLDLDLIILLGDRYEVFAAAQAALLLKVPVVHLHGGELTLGAIDDVFRHCITKIAGLHFVSCPEYKQRVVQLGEKPETVFVSGALGLENLQQDASLDLESCFTSIGTNSQLDYVVLTYHPETLSHQDQATVMDNIFSSLLENTDFRVLTSFPNMDAGNQKIIEKINSWKQKFQDRVVTVASFGRSRYLSLVKHAQFVIGNSSSGIIEVPSLRVPTINIGDRQKGRVAAPSVIHATADKASIQESIMNAMNPTFINDIKSQHNPYQQTESASSIIFAKLQAMKFNLAFSKEFYDVPSAFMPEDSSC